MSPLNWRHASGVQTETPPNSIQGGDCRETSFRTFVRTLNLAVRGTVASPKLGCRTWLKAARTLLMLERVWREMRREVKGCGAGCVDWRGCVRCKRGTSVPSL